METFEDKIQIPYEQQPFLDPYDNPNVPDDDKLDVAIATISRKLDDVAMAVKLSKTSDAIGKKSKEEKVIRALEQTNSRSHKNYKLMLMLFSIMAVALGFLIFRDIERVRIDKEISLLQKEPIDTKEPEKLLGNLEKNIGDKFFSSIMLIQDANDKRFDELLAELKKEKQAKKSQVIKYVYIKEPVPIKTKQNPVKPKKKEKKEAYKNISSQEVDKMVYKAMRQQEIKDGIPTVATPKPITSPKLPAAPKNIVPIGKTGFWNPETGAVYSK